jgi:cytochrome c oxidase subunit 3
LTEHHSATATHDAALAHHFEDLDQQRSASELGMWLFLVTEFMFFGGAFTAYLAYRFGHAEGFAAASHHMNVMLGTINTAVLLTSSFTMALAVRAAGLRLRGQLLGLLAATMALGVVFLVIKGFEYHEKYVEQHIPFAGLHFDWKEVDEPGAMTFFNLYFVMTGLHALHMVIGLVMMAILVVLVWRGKLMGEHSTAVNNAGLYWHFVDLVWVYLFPFFYLVAIRAAETGSH